MNTANTKESPKKHARNKALQGGKSLGLLAQKMLDHSDIHDEREPGSKKTTELGDEKFYEGTRIRQSLQTQMESTS